MKGVWHAPGRVNLIGEHTDYNDGFVLPFALPQGITVEAARRDDGLLELRSGHQTEIVELAGLAPGTVKGWASYVAGVAGCLRDAGHEVGGATIRITSDLPQGAGLSSSAALECATAVALSELYGRPVAEMDAAGRLELAKVAQRAENDYAGVPCGILDQSASMLGQADHALLLDCRSGLSSQIPLNLGDFRILIVNTMASHSLGDGEYATRRAACEKAAELLGVPALRDVKDLGEALSRLKDPELRKRVQHVVTENHRVQATVGLLKAGAIPEVGALLTASHLSLRDQYEVSWVEADVAVDVAIRAGARGARMVGGGFGGSIIALVHHERIDGVKEAVDKAYAERGFRAATYLEAVAAPGARRVS